MPKLPTTLVFQERAVGDRRTTRLRHRGEFLQPREAVEPGVPSVLPPLPAKTGSAYLRLEYRQTMEIAVVGAAALLTLADDGSLADARLAITAAAPVCLRVDAAEQALRGAQPTADALAAAAEQAAAAASPIDDVRASADYRRAMVSVIARRALEQALQRAKEST